MSEQARTFPAALVEELDELSYKRFRNETNQSQSFSADDAQRLRALISELWKVPKAGPGDVVAGARLESIVGKGAFGTVWRATKVGSGALRAVKIFDADRLGDGLAVHLFRRGVLAMQYLRRQNDEERSQGGQSEELSTFIVRICETEPHMLAFAMDWIPGGDLSKGYIRGRSLEEKLRVFRHIANAISYAHTRPESIVHRDIKPQNIVMDGDRPILTDFDIADMAFAKTLSRRAVGGAFAYAAPEQLAGDCEHLELRSDIYSLGRLLHFFLLEEDPPLLIERNPPLHELNDYPEGLVKIIRRCTHRELPMRYASVAALLVDLERYREAHDVGAFGPNPTMAGWHWSLAEERATKGSWKAAIDAGEQAQQYLSGGDDPRLRLWSTHLMWWRVRAGEIALLPGLVLMRLQRLSFPAALLLIFLMLTPMFVWMVDYVRTEAKQERLKETIQKLVSMRSLHTSEATLALSYIKVSPQRLRTAQKQLSAMLAGTKGAPACRIFTLLHKFAPRAASSIELQDIGQPRQAFSSVGMVEMLALAKRKYWGPIRCRAGRRFVWLKLANGLPRRGYERAIALAMPRADLRKLFGVNLDFSGSVLTGSDLRMSKLNRASFSKVEMAGADLSHSSMHRSRLEFVNATGASFRMADMRAARLTWGLFNFTDFRHVSFGRTDFRFARFQGALFSASAMPFLREGKIDARHFRDAVCLSGGHFLQPGLAERCHAWHLGRHTSREVAEQPPPHCPTVLSLFSLFVTFPPGALQREGVCPWRIRGVVLQNKKAASRPTKATSAPTTPR